MKNKKVISILIFLILTSHLGFAANEPEVAIQKSEGRTEAVVSSQPTVEQKPKRKLGSRIVSMPGDIIVWIGRTASAGAGKAADGSIKAVQVVGGFLLAPVFKASDVQGKIQKRQEPKS